MKKAKIISRKTSLSCQQSAFSRQQLLIKLFVLAFIIHYSLFTVHCFSQVGVGINTTGTVANVKAILDVSSSTQGLLVPRMTTTQRDAITAPIPESLLIFNTTTQCFEAYNSSTSAWVAFGCIGCQLPGVFTAIAASNVSATTFTANWTASSGATTYYLDVATDAGFSTFVPGYNNINSGNVLTQSIATLTCNTAYYYRVRANNSCGTSANSNTTSQNTSVCCTPPSITSTTPSSICGSGTVTLGATASAGTIHWYDVPTGGSSIGTGNSFTTPSISVTTTYYVDATDNGCTTGSRTSVVATVANPTILSTTPGSNICSGTVVLGATASSGATVNWYTALSGGSAIATGNSYTTPSISVTTTYYVAATQSGCTSSPRIAVIATIKKVAGIRVSTGFYGYTGGDYSNVTITFNQTPTGNSTPQSCLSGCTCGGSGTTFNMSANGSCLGTNVIVRDFTFSTYPTSVTINMVGHGVHTYNPTFYYVYDDGTTDYVAISSSCTADPYYYTTWSVTNTCSLATPPCHN